MVMFSRRLRFSSYFFFQAEDGIRDLVRSRGLGDVYKRQLHERVIDEIVDELTPEQAEELAQLQQSDDAILQQLSLIHI